MYRTNQVFKRLGQVLALQTALISAGPALAELEIARDLMEAGKFEQARHALWPAARSGNAEAEEVGQLTLADFANRRGLQPIGENFLTETEASGAALISNPQEEGVGKLIQGALEASNVNVVQELVEMIETQRAYEVSSKAITSVDEMLRFIANNL